ncbi:MAG: glycoside hydrolase, partial [Acidobacteriota bacterium]
GPGGGIYKSIDGGATWKELNGQGLPSGKLGRIGLDVARGTRGNRVYALIDAGRASGLFRSDDGGNNWSLLSTDPRILSRGWYFGEVRLHPKRPDVVYVSNVSLYRSTNGGKTFQAVRGAPGGDDYHSLWIDSENPDRMISGVDQGTIITLNGGQTWSSWYNQPTAQFYHVAVDNQFPYNVYGAQQDSGTAAVASRSDYGQITFRDWYPIGAGESGYILPDPENPQIVYGGSTSGETYRFDKKTGQVQDVSPTPSALGVKVTHRYPWTTAIAFAPQPPHAFYQASQFLMKTVDGGNHWNIISPDLTLRSGEKEEEAKGVIYTIAVSPRTVGTIWAGTDNSVIQLTRDEGKTWQDVSPPDLAPWSMVSIIEASPFEAGSAYAAVDRHQMDDIKPYIYRTQDFGKTWTRITNGLPEAGYVHVVREDPVRQGLLFAGTETGVYVSFDNGGNWQPLQLNLPITPIRDLLIKDNDLVVATHGRSFWILDDIAPLRELTAEIVSADAHLFKPALAIRLRKNESHDTPLQPETPAGRNPPPGAIIDFTLKSVPSGEVTLEISDRAGNLVRKFSSSDTPGAIDETLPFPSYWLRPPAPLGKQAGMNRFVWDLRYPRPPAMSPGYSIAVAFGEDATKIPEGPLVLPGTYQVKLTVGGRTYAASLEVKEDPRVKFAAGALEQQLAFEMKIVRSMTESFAAVQELQDLRRRLAELNGRLPNKPALRPVADAVKALDDKALALLGGPPQYPPSPVVSFTTLNSELGFLLFAVDGADSAPTTQATAAFDTHQELLQKQMAIWTAIKQTDLPTLNAMLREQGLAEISVR